LLSVWERLGVGVGVTVFDSESGSDSVLWDSESDTETPVDPVMAREGVALDVGRDAVPVRLRVSVKFASRVGVAAGRDHRVRVPLAVAETTLTQFWKTLSSTTLAQKSRQHRRMSACAHSLATPTA
jgi:hypothetical protein